MTLKKTDMGRRRPWAWLPAWTDLPVVGVAACSNSQRWAVCNVHDTEVCAWVHGSMGTWGGPMRALR